MYVYKSVAKSRVTNAHYIIHSVLTGSRSPAGLRRLGTAMRSCASLSRGLSVFFGSTPGQDPKAAKFAVLPPGHAGFPQRVKQSEGSDTTLPSETPPVSACEPLCAIFPRKLSVVLAFVRESERGPFVREAEKRDEKRFGAEL